MATTATLATPRSSSGTVPVAAAASFTGTLDADGVTATGIAVPADVVAALDGGRRARVVVTLGATTFRTSLGSVAGVTKVPVSAAVREAAGLRAGDVVEVTVARDDAPRVVTLPADLAEALHAEPEALRFFGTLGYSRQHAWASWVDSAKRPETRQRRVADAVAMLAAGRPQR